MSNVWIVQEENNKNFGEDYTGTFKTRRRAVAKVREIAEEYIEHMLDGDDDAVAKVREQLRTLEQEDGEGSVYPPGAQFSISLTQTGLV